MTTSWKGSLVCVGLSIPLKLVTTNTESRHKISLNQLCVDCNSPVGYKKYCKGELKDLPADKITTGYEIAKDQYVHITKDELASVKLRTTQELQVLYFVDAKNVDEAMVKDNYYGVPEPKYSVKPFVLFRQALELSGKVAIGKVVIRDLERYMVIKPFGEGLLIHELLYQEEANPLSDYKEIAAVTKAGNATTEKEIELAVTLIDKLSKPKIDYSEFVDHYVESARELITAKAEGKTIAVAVSKKVETESQSLTAALEASLVAVSAGGA